MNANPDKTLEQLENEIWEDTDHPSSLVATIHRLRKKPLKDFSTGDMRIMIGQQFSLDYIMPLAIQQLRKNILAEGDFYPGDLLKAVLDVNQSFWLNHKQYWEIIKKMVESNRKLLNPDRQIRKSIERFEDIYNE